MKNIITKVLSMFMAVLLLFYYSAYPLISYAQVEDPTPTIEQTETTPTEEPTPNIEESDEVIAEESTPTPEIVVENTAGVENEVTTDSNTGVNEVNYENNEQQPERSTNSESAVSSTTGGSEINTGDAVSVTAVENEVNTTSVNSNVIMQTVNIFVDQNGNLNLSDPYTLAQQAILDHPNDPVINLSVVNVSNFAYVTNTITSNANTGNNSIEGDSSGESSIDTGDAYSVVSLLNKVNFTIINSTIHIVTINVFGSLNGNIILPDLAEGSCVECSGGINAENNANVNNNVGSSANSGINSAEGEAEISTGDAKSIVNILNLINANITDTSIASLYINILGMWDGNFAGWYEFDPTTGGATLVFSSENEKGASCDSCDKSNVSNSANVSNNISSSANTGGNSLGHGGKIKTGNAFSAVSLINFINTSFVNSKGFFGFLNIFGNWKGNIGSQKALAAVGGETETESTSEPELESGGALAVSSSNNVGTHVNPGDTVTFFVDTTNTGTGKVYGAKLWLHLIKDGKDAGGAEFNLGDMPAGKVLHLSTGFVLTNNLEGGNYTARAIVTGTTGPKSEGVSATSENFFDVFGAVFAAVGQAQEEVFGSSEASSSTPESFILPASTSPKSDDFGNVWLLFYVFGAYILLRSIRERKRFAVVFSKGSNSVEKLKALKMILL